jgi:hypothetical protein
MTRTKKTVLMTHQPEHGQDKAQAKGRGRLDAAGGRVLVPRPSAVGHSVKVRGDGKRPKASRFASSRMSAFEALLSCRDAPTGSLCQLKTLMVDAAPALNAGKPTFPYRHLHGAWDRRGVGWFTHCNIISNRTVIFAEYPMG